MARINLQQRFTRLLTISQIDENTWQCLCDCGVILNVSCKSLLTEERKSCGCLRKDRQRESVLKHGESKTPIYIVWDGMRQRCLNPNHMHYSSYGGRGITICKDWENVLVFKSWVESTGYVKGATLDRIDNNQGYFPENCRWATRKDQANNRRNTRYVTYKGETKTIAQWADQFKVCWETMAYRVKHGVDLEHGRKKHG
jgi:hypothetical protein